MPAIVKPGATNPKSATVLWQSIMPTSFSFNGTSVPSNPAINLIDPATWSTWVSGPGAGSANYDFGVAIACNGFGIAAHEIGSLGVTYHVQYSIDGTTWADIHSQAPTNDEDIFCIFPTVTARYWRLHTDNPANVGIFAIGNRLIFPHAPVAGYTPLHRARKYEKEFADSIKGHFLGTRVMAAGAETDVNMGFFERPWLEANITPFERHYNQGGKFFYAGSPATAPLDVGYCRASSDNGSLEIEWTEAEKMATLSFGLRSYVGG